MGKQSINYYDPKIRKDVLVRQRKGLWTPEQVGSFARRFRLRPGMCLLDAGCGYGYAMNSYGPFCMPNATLVGLDLESILLKTARAKAGKKILNKRTHFVAGDVLGLPFKKNSFDISIAHVLLCHLREPEQALDELIRVTRRGGCVAVFDNAVHDGGSGWSNLLTKTIKQRVYDYELRLRMFRGRKLMGRGDVQVGCYVAHWLEKKGLKNVDARCNEIVTWIAPPYRSPAQKIEYRKLQARMLEPRDTSSAEYKSALKCMRKGGLGVKIIKKACRRGREHDRKFRKAFRKHTLSYAASYGGFWCIWGFKP